MIINGKKLVLKETEELNNNEKMTDLELMELLEEKGYEPSLENLKILKESPETLLELNRQTKYALEHPDTQDAAQIRAMEGFSKKDFEKVHTGKGGYNDNGRKLHIGRGYTYHAGDFSRPKNKMFYRSTGKGYNIGDDLGKKQYDVVSSGQLRYKAPVKINNKETKAEREVTKNYTDEEREHNITGNINSFKAKGYNVDGKFNKDYDRPGFNHYIYNSKGKLVYKSSNNGKKNTKHLLKAKKKIEKDYIKDSSGKTMSSELKKK